MPPFTITFYPPSPALSAYVTGYWRLRPNGGAGTAPHSYRALPDTRSNIVFNLSTTALEPTLRDDIALPSESASLCALADRHFNYRLTDALDLFGIQLRHEYLRGLLRCDISAITGHQIPLAEFFGRDTNTVLQRLLHAVEDRERITIVETFLGRRCGALASPDPLFLSAFSRLTTQSGPSILSALKRETGVSERRLERICSRHLGLSPKRFSELMRFWRASMMVQTGAPLNRIATTLEYFDQAHFCRVFRRYAGLPPGAYACEQSVGFVQDPGPSAL